MVDEGIAEHRSSRVRIAQALRRVPECCRERLICGQLGLVGVADNGCGGLKALFNAPETRADGCCKRQIGVGICAGDAEFDALGFG